MQYVFAANIYGEQEGTWGRHARAIAEAVLQDLGLWRADPESLAKS